MGPETVIHMLCPHNSQLPENTHYKLEEGRIWVLIIHKMEYYPFLTENLQVCAAGDWALEWEEQTAAFHDLLIEL